jgi:hypothetical protein
MVFGLLITPRLGTQTRRAPITAWRSRFEADFSTVVAGLDGSESAWLEVGPRGALIVSIELNSIEQIGPLVIELAKRHGADIFDARSGEQLAPPFDRVNWADVAIEAQQQHEADLAALGRSIELAGGRTDPTQITTSFAQALADGGAVSYRTMPSPIASLDLPLPERALLPDIEQTIESLRSGRRSDRAMAAFRLGGHPPNATTLQALRNSFSHDVDSYVRTVAGKSLAMIGDTSVLDPLESMLAELPGSVAPSELVQAVSNVLHAMVLIAIVDHDRSDEVTTILSTFRDDASDELARRVGHLKSMLRDARETHTPPR